MDNVVRSVRDMTDQELISRLSTHGFKAGPITVTTRSVYEKKLVNFIRHETLTPTSSNTNGDRSMEGMSPRQSTCNFNDTIPTTESLTPVRRGRKSLPLPSPTKSGSQMLTPTKDSDHDHESEEEPPLSTTKKNTRRVTLGGLSPRPLPTTSPKTVVSSPSSAVTRSKHQSNTPMRSLHTYSSEEEEDSEEPHNGVNGFNDNQPQPSPRRSVMNRTVGGKMSTPTVAFNVPSDVPSSSRTPISKRKSPKRASFAVGSPQMTSRADPSTQNFSDSETESALMEPPSPVSSQESQVLRQRRRSNTRLSRAFNVVSQASRDYDDGRTSLTESSSFGSYNWVSIAILTVSCLFFLGIFSYYIYNSSLDKTARVNPSDPISSSPVKTFDAEEELLSKINLPMCGTEEHEFSRNCIKSKSDAKAALRVVREIRGYFESRLLDYYCDPEAVDVPMNPEKMTVDEVRKILVPRLLEAEAYGEIFGMTDGNVDDRITRLNRINSVIGDALTLIRHNSNRFKISVDYLPNSDDSKLRVDPVSFPVSYPVSCKLRIGLVGALWKVILFVLLAGGVYGVYHVTASRKRQKSYEQHLFLELLEKSLELLQSPDEPGSMPVLHIRDTVLSPTEKKDPILLRVWERVVGHVEKNESRVKVANEEFEGETFKTWKWVCPIISDSSGNFKTGSIEWQGHASVVNPTPLRASSTYPSSSSQHNSQSPSSHMDSNFVAPTSFLKVRNMFDEETVASARMRNDSYWKTKIRNAILVKCCMRASVDGHGITHIFVDERFAKEGLVYIKCRDIPYASAAYNSLHGWWCEKKLVSVRFLKPERYYSRFPEARGAMTDLRLDPVDEEV